MDNSSSSWWRMIVPSVASIASLALTWKIMRTKRPGSRPSERLVVRPAANLSEVADFHASLAKAEHWNPGLCDHEAFWAIDPTGFLLGELDGGVVACISGVRYNEAYGFIGYLIVLPQYRRLGLGRKMWQAGES